jgi:DNA-binding SARP family transcriptional activator
MDLRLLGPVEASHASSALDLGPPKQRAVLARLALDANRTVRLEQLLDELWEDELPRSATKMIQIYASQLRKVLPAGTLLTEGNGYRLMLEPGARDIDRVATLRLEATAASAKGDPAKASGLLAEALALWRGPALAELSEPFAQRERARLEELRLACQEDRIDADLAAGAHGDLVGELETLIGLHRLRERPRAQLMLALYRAGRQAEALAAYQAFRRTLDDELGLEPSAELRALEAAILRRDAALAIASEAGDASAAQLPGRAAELERLARALADARAGRRRAVFISGEPGLGKTALVDAFVSGASGVQVGRGQCVEDGGDEEAYLPLIDAVVDLVGGPDGDEVLATLEDAAPTWMAMTGRRLPVAVEQRAQGATAQRMRREAVQALEALAARRPVVLVLEDLQWADEATLGLLEVLLRRTRPARVLIVGTFRAEDGPAGSVVRQATGQRLAEELALAPLDVAAIAALVGDRLGAERVPPALVGVVHERCAGNPLFASLIVDHWISEQTVAVRNGEAVPVVDVGELAVTVPPTIRASLAARLERLDNEERDVLEAASLAGESFTVIEVAAALARPVADVRSSCERSARRLGILERRGPDAFAFVHELHRDAVRDLIDAERRAALHRRIGAHLEQSMGAADQPGRIALHLIEGGDALGAVRFLHVGAERALARNAHGIAIRRLRRALEIVETEPTGPIRARSEVELLTGLSQAFVGADGWGAPDAEDALLRARSLAERLGDNEPLLGVLFALATIYEVRGEFGRAEEMVRACEPLAPDGLEGHRLESAELVACNLFHQGSFVRALEHADRGVALFDAGLEDGTYATFTGTFGDNAVVGCHDWAGLALWFIGRPDEALARARHALELAQDPARRYSLAQAETQLASIHQCRAEPEETRRWAQRAMDTAAEAGYRFREATAQILRGWARARLGEGDAGIDDLVSGLAASRATGALIHDPLHLGMLADAYVVLGEPDAALRAIDEGLDLALRGRSAFYLPELHRLRAVALAGSGAPPADVEEAFAAALEIARRDQSRSLELRATVGLARFWAASGRAAEGRAMVAAALGQFNEGHDAPDLREAAAMLGRAYPTLTE